MIELTFCAAFMLYLSLTLTFVLGLWGYQHYRVRKKAIFFPEKNLLICEYCHYLYLDKDLKKISQCPQCRSFNQFNLYPKDKCR